jgi:capsular polysaccharide biosynthesis protein
MKYLRCALPCNFDQNDPEFNAFKDYSENFDEENTKIKRFGSVRVLNNGAIFNYFNIIDISAISKKFNDKLYRIFIKFIPKINFYKDKRFVLIFDQWTDNYYHWHLIAIHRLIILQENNLLEDSVILLPSGYKNFFYVKDTLKKFGIKEECIIYLNGISHIKVKELFLVETKNYFAYTKEIKKFLTNNVRNTINMGDKIYISRQKCSMRYIKNENDLVPLIEKYGFKKVIMEDYSYEDQISIASNTKYMIGPHGAGLTNALFMKDGSSLLELAAKLVHYGNAPTDYYKMSAMSNINYFFQDCEVVAKSKDCPATFHGILSADLEKLEKNIQLMLKVFLKNH